MENCTSTTNMNILGSGDTIIYTSDFIDTLTNEDKQIIANQTMFNLFMYAPEQIKIAVLIKDLTETVNMLVHFEKEIGEDETDFIELNKKLVIKLNEILLKHLPGYEPIDEQNINSITTTEIIPKAIELLNCLQNMLKNNTI